MNEEYYILTPQQAKAYEKEALKYRTSLYQMVSGSCSNGGTGIEDEICGIVDRIMYDVARVVVEPWHYKEHFIPFTADYPQMVCRAMTGRIEDLKVTLRDQVDDDGRIASMTLRNNRWHISDSYKGWYDIMWDTHPLHSIYCDAANVVSSGWGDLTYCLKPEIAVEVFLILDDMTGYLRSELRELFYKVKKEIACRQVEMVSVLAAVKEAGFKYYRLWVNSSRTVALNVRLNGCREVDVTLYPRT